MYIYLKYFDISNTCNLNVEMLEGFNRTLICTFYYYIVYYDFKNTW